MLTNKFIRKLIFQCGDNDQVYTSRRFAYKCRYFYTSNGELELVIYRISKRLFDAAYEFSWDVVYTAIV